jgi:flagellar FliJ protein
MQSILNIKLKTEDQARMEFGAAKHRLDLENDRLEQMMEKRLGYLEEGRDLQKDRLKVHEIIDNRQYMKTMDDLIEQQKQTIRKAEKAVDVARIRLTTVMQERKMQEKLREKAFETFVQDEKEAEARETDQRSSFTYGQRIQNNR